MSKNCLLWSYLHGLELVGLLDDLLGIFALPPVQLCQLLLPGQELLLQGRNGGLGSLALADAAGNGLLLAQPLSDVLDRGRLDLKAPKKNGLISSAGFFFQS